MSFVAVLGQSFCSLFKSCKAFTNVCRKTKQVDYLLQYVMGILHIHLKYSYDIKIPVPSPTSLELRS